MLQRPARAAGAASRAERRWGRGRVGVVNCVGEERLGIAAVAIGIAERDAAGRCIREGWGITASRQLTVIQASCSVDVRRAWCAQGLPAQGRAGVAAHRS